MTQNWAVMPSLEELTLGPQQDRGAFPLHPSAWQGRTCGLNSAPSRHLRALEALPARAEERLKLSHTSLLQADQCTEGRECFVGSYVSQAMGRKL